MLVHPCCLPSMVRSSPSTSDSIVSLDDITGLFALILVRDRLSKNTRVDLEVDDAVVKKPLVMAPNGRTGPTDLPVSFSPSCSSSTLVSTPVAPGPPRPPGASGRPRSPPAGRVRRAACSPPLRRPGRVLDPGRRRHRRTRGKRNWSSAKIPLGARWPLGAQGNVCFSPAQLDSILPLIALGVQVRSRW